MPVNSFRSALGVFALAALIGCEASSVNTTPAELGVASDRASILTALGRGPIELKKQLAATWEVPLSGVIDLKDPKAIAAGLEDRGEAIDVFVYTLKHPTAGTFIVDSGISALFREPGGHPGISLLLKKYMNTQVLDVKLSTAKLLENQGPIDGVFLTHIHFDHIMGLNDLPADTAVFIGQGDARARAFLNVFSRGTIDRLLATQNQLREWQFDGKKILDVFGDASLFAIHSPGHTPGSTAYLAMTTEGPQLLLGDTTHTSWGWENGVGAGSYTADTIQSRESLLWLKALAADLPSVIVHPGHQPLGL